jgi:putative SOS response-associated peptidase YedK
VCNLYSMVTNRKAIGDLFRFTGGWNRLHVPSVFPDQVAPIVRQSSAGEREILEARWGMPTPIEHLRDPAAPDRGVTNIRRPMIPHWKRWMHPANRCLVPFTSFCEPTDAADPGTGKKVWTWFATNEDRSLMAFAGIWCQWQGLRGTKKNPQAGEHTLFGFLTTDANDDVRPVHSKSMPVILRTPEECDAWLSVDLGAALKIQKPLPNEALMIVARGAQEDPPPPPSPAENTDAAVPELPL